MILACVQDGVLPDYALPANGGGEVSVVLCDRVRGWWDLCYDSLLERLKAVGLF
jgi:hypothetical protein